jgi:uncharacterized C2H2 Zn-finger protein
MYKCDKCQKEYYNKSDYNKHLNKIKPCGIKTDFKCDICLKIFTTKQSLDRHKNKKNHVNHM